MEQPWQQTRAELWDEVTDTLCNLDFIQAKAVAKMTFDLVRNFNDVLGVIPDNAENIRQEKARQERMIIFPTRLDKLRNFINFPGKEAANLQNYALQCNTLIVLTLHRGRGLIIKILV
jgi:hypothetical protein